MIAPKKIPVNISVVRSQDGQEHRVPTVPLGEILDTKSNAQFQGEIQAFAAKYEHLLKGCREVLAAISLEKKLLGRANPLLYWEMGDRIHRFVKDEAASQFFINGFWWQLSADLSVSPSLLQRTAQFRERLLKSEIDANKSWDFYRLQITDGK